MGRQIIQQPDGKFAIWSSVVDGFVILDASKEDIAELFGNEAHRQAANDVYRICSELRNGHRPYYQFTMTWEEALKRHEERHGPLSGAEIREG